MHSKLKRFLVILSLIFPLFQTVRSQDSTYIINEKEKSFPSNLAYDKPMQFKYVGNALNPVTYIGLFEINRKGCIVRGYPERCEVKRLKQQRKYEIDSLILANKKAKGKSDSDTTLECPSCKANFRRFFSNHKQKSDSIRAKYRELIRVARSEETAYPLYANFNNTSTEVFFVMPPLRASRNYKLYVIPRNHDADLDSILNSLFKNEYTKAEQFMRKQENSYYKNDCHFCQCDESGRYVFDSLKTYYLKNVQSIKRELVDSLHKLKLANTIDNLNLPLIKTSRDEPVKSGLSDFYKYINRSDSIAKKDFVKSWPDIAKNLSRANYFLTSENLLQPKSFSFGRQTLNKPEHLDTGLPIDSLIVNLKRSRDTLWPLLHYYEFYCMRTPGCHTNDPAKIYLNNMYTGLGTNLEILTKHKSYLNSLKAKITQLKTEHDSIIWDFPYFIHKATALDINSSYTFSPKATSILALDVGFIGYTDFKNNSLSGGSLAFGFHIAFTPLDRDVAFKFRREKRLSDRISFNGGILLNDFNEEGKRSGLIGNRAVYTGLGYARTPWLRFHSGLVWYKANHENPLRNNLSTAVAPYLGFNFDLDITKLIESITKFIGL